MLYFSVNYKYYDNGKYVCWMGDIVDEPKIPNDLQGMEANFEYGVKWFCDKVTAIKWIDSQGGMLSLIDNRYGRTSVRK